MPRKRRRVANLFSCLQNRRIIGSGRGPGKKEIPPRFALPEISRKPFCDKDVETGSGALADVADAREARPKTGKTSGRGRELDQAAGADQALELEAVAGLVHVSVDRRVGDRDPQAMLVADPTQQRTRRLVGAELPEARGEAMMKKEGMAGAPLVGDLDQPGLGPLAPGAGPLSYSPVQSDLLGCGRPGGHRRAWQGQR